MNINYKLTTGIFAVLSVILIVFISGWYPSGEHSCQNMKNGEKCPMMQKMDTMSGMMHGMTQNLEGKTGAAFDQAFLSDMIIHHQGAIDMARMVLQKSDRPELRKLAEDIISAQSKEITQMQNWQKAWTQ